MIYSPLSSILHWPPWKRQPVPEPPTPRIAPELMEQIEARIREIQVQAQAEVKELRTSLLDQARQIEKLEIAERELRISEARAQGDLREAHSRITMLEGQVIEERKAREKQNLEAAREAGRMTSELEQADKRLKFQRDEITQMQQQLAVLTEERSHAINVSTVWKARAEKAAEQLQALGVTPAWKMAGAD